MFMRLAQILLLKYKPPKCHFLVLFSHLMITILHVWLLFDSFQIDLRCAEVDIISSTFRGGGKCHKMFMYAAFVVLSYIICVVLNLSGFNFLKYVFSR